MLAVDFTYFFWYNKIKKGDKIYMSSNKIYSYDKETKTAYCKLKYDDSTIITGKAVCHPDDEDMESEKTGL